MAQLPSQFRSDEHGEMSTFEPLPSGSYNLVISETDYVENSKKTGHILKITMTVEGGDHDGKKLFRNLNLDNPNRVAVEIAQKEFATILRALGIVAIDDTEELHGKRLTAKITYKAGNVAKEIAPSNDVAGYSPLDGAATPEKSESTGKKGGKKKLVSFDDDDE